MSYNKLPIFPFLLVFYEIVTYLSNDMYLPALPQMMSHLQLTMSQVQLTLTMWFIGGAIMPIVMGAIADAYGRRPVLLVGGLIYILSTVICALTSNFTVLLAARLIEGGMVASMLVPGYAAIHESFQKKEAVRILALMGSISVLAPALGPLLGGLVLYVTSWRGIFWLIAFAAVIAITLLYFYLPETLAAEQRKPLHMGSLMRSYGRILANKSFMLHLLTLGFIFGGFIAWISAGPLLVIDSFHYSALMFGVMQMIVFGAYIAGSHGVTHLLSKLTIQRLIQLGVIVTLIGGVGITVCALIWPDSLSAFLIMMTIYSFGSALCFAPLNRATIESSDEPMGTRVAAFSVAILGFAAFGTAMTSVLFNGSILSLGGFITAAIVISGLLSIPLLKLPNQTK